MISNVLKLLNRLFIREMKSNNINKNAKNQNILNILYYRNNKLKKKITKLFNIKIKFRNIIKILK